MDLTKIAGGSAQGAGQPVEPSKTEGAQETAPEKVGFNPDAFRESLKQDISGMLSSFESRMQSAQDKRDNRLKAEVDRVRDMFKKAGAEVDDNTARQIAQENISKSEEPPQASPQAPAQAPKVEQPKQDAGENPIVSAAELAVADLHKEYGIEIEEADDEAKTLDYSGLAKFLRSYEAALKSKQSRLTPQKESVPGASVPTIGGGDTPGNPIANIKDPTTLLTMGLVKKK